MLSLITKPPPNEDLMNLFMLQSDVHFPKNREFYVEYLFWYSQAADNPNRTYDGLWKLTRDWVRRKKDIKNSRKKTVPTRSQLISVSASIARMTDECTNNNH